MNGSRVRARHSGFVSPVTRHPVFRIEDQDGRVLRRISSARSPGEAMAHYWRSGSGDASFSASMPELPPDASLHRRIAKAHAARGRGTAGHEAMQTHELPLPEVPVEPGVVAEAATGAEAEDGVDVGTDVETVQEVPAQARPARPARRRPAAPRQKLADLFETPVEDDVTAPDEPVVAAPEPEPVADEPEPVADEVPAPEARPEPPAPRPPHHLDAQQVMLAPVDHRNLRPSDKPDSYLYHVSNRAEADLALRNGLVVSANDPVILTERPGVAYWLSVLAEDFDFILDGPADFVVLRLRRFTVDSLLEPDPDASRSAGCACYLLTGGETKLSA